MSLSLFVRMRDLMFLDATLQTYFGPTSDTLKFRVFDRQMPQGQISQGTCATIQTVSQVTRTQHGPTDAQCADRRPRADQRHRQESDRGPAMLLKPFAIS